MYLRLPNFLKSYVLGGGDLGFQVRKFHNLWKNIEDNPSIVV